MYFSIIFENMHHVIKLHFRIKKEKENWIKLSFESSFAFFIGYMKEKFTWWCEILYMTKRILCLSKL